MTIANLRLSLLMMEGPTTCLPPGDPSREMD
jgi:hypothetical protein